MTTASTNNPNVLDLNRTINTSSSDEAERIAYERMQQVGFKIADILMEMPLGTMSDLGQGECLFVAPHGGKMEIFSTPDWHDDCRWNEVSWFFLNDFQGLGTDDLDEHRILMENWLKNPVFRQCVPADNAFKVLASLDMEESSPAQQSTPANAGSLNRYEHHQIKDLIVGYMVPSKSLPLESHEQQFHLAKRELVANLERRLEQVKCFTYEDMHKKVS